MREGYGEKQYLREWPCCAENREFFCVRERLSLTASARMLTGFILLVVFQHFETRYKSSLVEAELGGMTSLAY